MTSPLVKETQLTSTSSPSVLCRKSPFADFSSPELAKSNSTIVADAPLTVSPCELAPVADSFAFCRPEESKSLQQRLSSRLSHAGTLLRRRQSLVTPPLASKVESAPAISGTGENGHLLVEKLKEIPKPNQQTSIQSSDVGGPRFQVASPNVDDRPDRTAGDPQVYADIKVCLNLTFYISCVIGKTGSL